ncbi:carboxypeptidase regulatory-like domain-containing protein [Archangium violaceum]|uniref:carboxypeptidase regulatory-like domain-containing protein n=1 Tax=Archangium violaceum TaxID=83451 RepID=UPI00194EFD87|nr:carboxypeptidase regulatory-like domain-containing protein [Archangium violaceum]QRN95554.1 carboxypeptidase regulatory-like domain-containing protein [Archangium violaceum]
MMSELLAMPLSSPRGSLAIEGTVVGPEGPVPGIVVIATAPQPGEALVDQPCRCEDHCARELLELGCGSVEAQLAEWVVAHEDDALPLARVVTDAAGRFRLEGLEAGSHTLWAQSERHAGVHPEVAAGAQGVELRVDEGTWLSRVARDEDGRPLAGARFTALLHAPGRLFEKSTRDDGFAILGPLPRGEYTLLVEKEGLLPAVVRMSSAFDVGQEVTLYRPRRVSGRVEAGGGPAEGLTVLLTGEHRRLQAMTDSRGLFTFEGLRTGSYEVTVRRDELLAARRVTVEPGLDVEEVVLELAPGMGLGLSGRVTDEAGHPIAGARVDAARGAGEYGSFEWHTLTDAQGRYLLALPGPGTYRFLFDSERHQQYRLPARPYEHSEELDVTLEPSVLVEGHTVDESGAPVSGVEVYRVEPVEGSDFFDRVGRWDTSRRDGSFMLEGPEPGTWYLVPEHKDFLDARLTLQAPAREVKVVLRRGASVEVEVVDEAERPVVDAWVKLEPERRAGTASGLQEHQRMRRQTKQGATGMDGRRVFSGLLPGRFKVEVTARRVLSRRVAHGEVEVRGTEQGRVRLRLTEGKGGFAGVVVDGEGKPLEYAMVRATPVEFARVRPGEPYQDEGGEGLDMEGTGPDGRFTFSRLRGEAWAVTAYKDGYFLDVEASGEGLEIAAPREWNVLARGTEEVRLVLARLPHVSGRVVREDGTPVTRFEVDSRSMSHPEGQFSVAMRGTGEQRVWFKAPGLSTTHRVVQVRQGEDVALGDVVLRAKRTVRGRVVDAVTRAPVAGATVEEGFASRRAYRRRTEEIPQARTRGDGSFTLTVGGEGVLPLTVLHSSYRAVELTVAEGRDEVVVELEPGATVEGQVLSGSLAVEAGRVELRDERDASVGTAVIWRGRYVLRAVPAGPHVLHVEGAMAGTQAVAFLPRRVEVPARGAVTVDLQLEGSGTASIRVAESVSAVWLVPGAHALPDEPDGLSSLRGRGVRATYENGLYRVRGLPPGRYTLLVQRFEEYYSEAHAEEVELRPGADPTWEVRPRWRRYEDG